jgi:hypothetical protein
MSELTDSTKYNGLLDCSLKEIIELYMRIVVDYLHFMAKTENIKKKNSFKFILLRGLETMTHVFNYILFSTKNLDLTEMYSEKSMFYYVEFISQISNLNANSEINTFMQITSRDAVVYVYKKTIYDIQKSLIIQSDEDTKKTCDDVIHYTQLVIEACSKQDNLLEKKTMEKFEQFFSKIKTVNGFSKFVKMVELI